MESIHAMVSRFSAIKCNWNWYIFSILSGDSGGLCNFLLLHLFEPTTFNNFSFSKKFTIILTPQNQNNSNFLNHRCNHPRWNSSWNRQFWISSLRRWKFASCLRQSWRSARTKFYPSANRGLISIFKEAMKKENCQSTMYSLQETLQSAINKIKNVIEFCLFLNFLINQNLW